MDVYYHYTTPEAAKSIHRSGVIKMSSKTAKRRDAVYGNGVYLTQILLLDLSFILNLRLGSLPNHFLHRPSPFLSD